MLNPDDIKQLVSAYGGQTGLAVAAKVTQPTVSRWLKGATPDPAQEAQLRRLLAQKQILTTTPEPDFPPTLSFKAQGIKFDGSATMPVYAAVEGGPGELVISTDAINYVGRPWYLGNVSDGYAVLVVGESMEPAYEEGDLAVVNPRLPPMKHKTHIFTTGHQDDGTFKGTIKRLVGQTSTEWKVLQYNPRREFVLSKADWPKALRVVGKYEG